MTTTLIALTLLLLSSLPVLTSSDTTESLQDISLLERAQRQLTSSTVESRDFAEVVAPRNVGTHKCSVTDRITKGFKNSGLCARMTIAESPEFCANLCLSVLVRCRAINYDYESKSCCFIYEPGNTVAEKGSATAFINIDLVMWCNPEYFELNHSRKCGDDASECTEYSVSSASDCCVTCFSEPGCVQFVYDSANHKCWLQNTVSTTGNIEYQGRASGLMCSEY